MKRLACLALLACALSVAGCRSAAPEAEAPLQVSAIGFRAAPGDPDTGPLDTPRRLIMAATAQGLVGFDADGQIVPALAESWLVTDEGRSYVFRIRMAEWPDGTPVTTQQVARVLKRAIAPRSRNTLAPYLTAIDDIVAMTDKVIEVRLSRPRPDLLKLFAQPELALLRPATLDGSGPYRLRPDGSGGAMLALPPDAGRDAEDGDAARGGDTIHLRGERAALGVARFKLGTTDLVLGGSFADWPIVAAAQIPETSIRLDPASGMFGLAVVDRNGFLATPENRAAVAMAIDRAAVTGSIRPDWAPIETVLPAQLDSAAPPASPQWTSLAFEARQAMARQRVAAWQRSNPGPLTIRLALPPGTGATRVWSAIARSLVAVGISVRRTDINEPSDLRLVDVVAPYDSARWFLATACRLCGADVALAIDAARDAPTLDARAHRIAEADAAIAADGAYIPIAQPLRWAIVSNRITGWRGNARAWHPLNHLRNESE